jgi:hypothetical protein
MQGFYGLALAIYANFIPKAVGRFRDPVSAMRWEAVLRVSGWAYMLGGLAYAAAGLLGFPNPVPFALLGTATAYVMGYSAQAFMEPGPRQCGLI